MTAPAVQPRRHNAQAIRAATGWHRWSSACSCGWRAEASCREDAEHIAKVHAWSVPAERRIVNALPIVQELPCRCGLDYDPETMEWAADQKPCARCRLWELLGGAA